LLFRLDQRRAQVRSLLDSSLPVCRDIFPDVILEESHGTSDCEETSVAKIRFGLMFQSGGVVDVILKIENYLAFQFRPNRLNLPHNFNIGLVRNGS